MAHRTKSSLQQAVESHASSTKEQEGSGFESQFLHGLDFSEFEGNNTSSSSNQNKSASARMLNHKELQRSRDELEQREEYELFQKVAQHQLNASTNDAANLLAETLNVSTTKKSVHEMTVSDSLELMHGGDMNGGVRQLRKSRVRSQKGKVRSKGLDVLKVKKVQKQTKLKSTARKR